MRKIVRAGLVAAAAVAAVGAAVPMAGAAESDSVPSEVKGGISTNFYLDNGSCVYWVEPGPPLRYTVLYCYA